MRIICRECKLLHKTVNLADRKSTDARYSFNIANYNYYKEMVYVFIYTSYHHISSCENSCSTAVQNSLQLCCVDTNAHFGK